MSLVAADLAMGKETPYKLCDNDGDEECWFGRGKNLLVGACSGMSDGSWSSVVGRAAMCLCGNDDMRWAVLS